MIIYFIYHIKNVNYVEKNKLLPVIFEVMFFIDNISFIDL